MDPRTKANRLILRGYGPLAGLVVLLLFLTMLVPSRPLSTIALSGGTGVPGAPVPVPTEEEFDEAGAAVPVGEEAVTGTTIAAAAGTTAVSGPAATGATNRRGSRTAASGAPGAARPGTTNPGSAGGAKPGTVSGPGTVTIGRDCPGGALQDPNTPYSPPCLKWNGTDNGGNTSRGVSGDTITVVMRERAESGGSGGRDQEKLREQARQKGLTDTKEDQIRSRDALLEYFNSRFQLYGRKVKLVTYEGRGDMVKEFAGSGQEEANADALKVGQEIGAFADLSAISQPYLDALVRQKVIAFGGLHLPESYYQSKAPYAWGQLIDCTTLVQNATDLLAKRFKASEPAGRAGSAAMRQKPRKYGLLVPDDPVYKQCVEDGKPRLKAAGIDVAKEINYSLDFAKMQQEAPNMAAQLKGAGVTTVILVTDPILPYFLTGAATQQDYWPEWFVSGSALTDIDILGQFYDQDQWQFAYGQSFLSDIFQGKDSESYRAFKAVRPNEEPAITRDQYYYNFLMLFIGLQMAGPNLTPETFAAGMYAYPARTGSFGRWSFSPTDHTCSDDAREMYYDRNAVSAFNNKPGRWVTLHGGRRFRGASWPADPPPAPIPAAAAP
ncbi:MAG TPA: ABC transporter substrate-binding protein [Acidimicrobiia bacterium]|nr:ABC transporter substrate-binding protein [Acidimicrobiia bacterium]